MYTLLFILALIAAPFIGVVLSKAIIKLTYRITDEEKGI